MNTNLGALRWMNSGTAAACYEVKALAPTLANLLYDPIMPERPLAAVLDWAETAAAPGSMAAFELSCLRSVLPAMVTAYVASHTYQLEPAGDRNEESDRLVLRDTGHGAVVGRIMMLLTEVVAPIHGEAGRELAQASRGDLARALFRIIDRINDQ